MIPGNDKWACRPVILLPGMPEMDHFIQSEAWALVARYLAGDVDHAEMEQWLAHCRECVIEGLEVSMRMEVAA